MDLTTNHRSSNQRFLSTYSRNYITSLYCVSYLRHPIFPRQTKSSQDRPKWMVMGFGRLLFKVTSNTLASLSFASILYLLTVSLLLHSATGRLSANCRVDNCINPYKRANHRLEVAEERSSATADIPRRRCRILSRLHRCLQKMRKACRGDLTFHAMKHMTDRDLDTYNCSAKPKKISPIVGSFFPSKTDPELPIINSTSVSTTTFPREVTEGGACAFSGKPNYKHCGMFGDPHLRTFSDKFFTCIIEKTWPLIDNDHMVVMVTNVPVREGSSATVTTKITVLIKPAGECAGQQHYIATSEQLSGAFTDGSSTTGSVAVVEVISGRQVEIRARFIATTIIIRKVGRYLTFAIRMPEEFINGLDAKTQLCTGGCPAKHQILPTDINKESLFSSDRQTAFQSQNDETNSFSTNKVPNSLDDLINSPEMLQNELSTPTASPLSKPTRRCYTEKEARLKCKQIMLARTTEVQEHVDSTDDKNSDDIDKQRRLAPSQSSEAFSSLIPSTRRNSRKGRKRNRMAAAKRPEAEMSQSSFKQLFGFEEEETVATLPRQPGAESRRKRKQKNRNKRNTEVGGDSANSRATKEAPRVGKAKHDMPAFNFYFESCVFDLMTTGDVNFTLAARAALEDVQRTHVLREQAPGASLEVIKQWQPENIRETGCIPMLPEPKQDTTESYNGGAGTPRLCWSVILCLVVSCVYINSISWLTSFSPAYTVTPSKQPLTQSSMISFQHQQERTLMLNNRAALR